MQQLYHYVHCPFCLRVRFALGFLRQEWDSIVLPYDDEKTPIQLANKKMLPIMKFADGSILNESLDIIEKIDTENRLKTNLLKNNSLQQNDFQNKLDQLSDPLFKLCMPYFIYSKEFTPKARDYFLAKKEAKRGPFHLLMQKDQRAQHEQLVQQYIAGFSVQLSPFYQSDQISIFDIALASHLWGLYCVPEFRFEDKVHQYLQMIKNQCHFDYHEDFWKSAQAPF